jgi:hypothetical protein
MGRTQQRVENSYLLNGAIKITRIDAPPDLIRRPTHERMDLSEESNHLALGNLLIGHLFSGHSVAFG